MEDAEISSISHVTLSPSRQNHVAVCSLPFSKSSYSVISAFCTEDNVHQCISYLNQEIALLGLSMGIEASSPEGRSLNAVPTLNVMYELLQIQKRNMCTLEEMGNEQLKKLNTLEHMQMSNSRLKARPVGAVNKGEIGSARDREAASAENQDSTGLPEDGKEEVQKLQSIIASRASQYSHDAKRKEREASKLKERLSQLLVDRKEKETSHEREMYKALVDDYEASRKALILENAELKKVLRQMKKEMMHILSPQQQPTSGYAADGLEQVDEEKAADTSREALDQSCELAREQLLNSIRQQWRKLRNHVEKLDHASQVQNQMESNKDTIPLETHEDEMERMKQEVQQCREFIHAQQQLLQQQLNTSVDDETAALLNDGYTLEEKERLKEEWKLFEEQKRNFEKERRNFTEAAIRLGREKMAFEEDRAAWLKNQFLNITPFRDRRRGSSSDAHSALSIRSEPEIRTSSVRAKRSKSPTYTTFSTPKPSRSSPVLSTIELYRTLRLLSDSSSYNHSNRGRWQESSTIEDRRPRIRSNIQPHAGEISIFTSGDDHSVA